MNYWNADLYKNQHAFVFEQGNSLIALLQPQPGSAILDLGCGTGELTAKLAETGAEVTGLDASESMILSARKHFPNIHFEIADATSFQLPTQFDGIFSNATLHWIREAEKVIERMHAHLKPGGRIAIEMGGKGNVNSILRELEYVMQEKGYTYEPFWYFPSPAEYCTLLEKAGFTIETVHFFERPTKLHDAENGISTWLEMFGNHFFAAVPEPVKKEILQKVQQELGPALTREGNLYADYVRLRVAAVKK